MKPRGIEFVVPGDRVADSEVRTPYGARGGARELLSPSRQWVSLGPPFIVIVWRKYATLHQVFARGHFDTDMTDTAPKIVSSGVKHEEIPVPVPVQVERSKRRGSVLRREVLERLQQGKGGSPADEDDGGGAPGGGRRGAPGGESIAYLQI